MAGTREKIVTKIRKLLALASRGATEEEAASATRRAHQLLAEHNLQQADLAEPLDWGDRVLDESSFDGARERWPIDLWVATARLHFCSYFYREHKDAGRCIGRQHSLVGRRPNVDVTKMTAQYLFDTVLRLTAEAGRTRPTCERRSYRDSFRRACGLRLAQRVLALFDEATSLADTLPSHNLPALLSLYASESLENRKFRDQQGIELVAAQSLSDRLTHAGGAAAGRLAAETIGLHRQISAAPGRHATGLADEGDQLALFA